MIVDAADALIVVAEEALNLADLHTPRFVCLCELSSDNKYLPFTKQARSAGVSIQIDNPKRIVLCAV